MNEPLHLDYETRSVLDLSEVGLDRYAKHPSTQVLLAAYAFGDRVPQVWQPHLRPEIPSELREALEDPFTIVHAWNAAFERNITRYVVGIDKPIEEWRDPMCQARFLSLPGSLDGAGDALGLKEGQSKIKDGKRLIRLFCEPESEGEENSLLGISAPTFRDWRTDPQDWKRFCEYCHQDVVAERAIARKLRKFPLPDFEWDTWFLSERINENGLPVDLTLVAGARAIVDKELGRLTLELKERTGLQNPNSGAQLLPWLREQGYGFSSLGKAFVRRALDGECPLSEEAKIVLELRGQTAKSSVKKYTAIADTTSDDGRLRHAYQYMGAARTGRFSSLGANMANLSKPSKDVEKRMDRAVELVRKMDYDAILKEFGKPLDVVTGTVRSSFRAPDGQKFVVCDLGAIENRVLGWVSRCDKILKVFRSTFTYFGPDYPEKGIFNGQSFPIDPYLDFATQMYGQSYHDLWVEWKIKGDSTKRNNCKPAVLGCGFLLGPGEERIDEQTGDRVFTGLMGYAKALGVEMTREDCEYSVRVFRETYTEVTWFWKDVFNAALYSIRHPGEWVGVGTPLTDRDRDYFAKIGHPLNWEPKIQYYCHGSKVLEMKLPSGRSLHYINPRIEKEPAKFQNREYIKDVIYYDGKDTGSQSWGLCKASPGRLTENPVQAIARDILVNGMKLADEMGFGIVLHSYDEIGTLVREDSSLGERELAACMTATLPWAPDLPLVAEGYEGKLYKK